MLISLICLESPDLILDWIFFYDVSTLKRVQLNTTMNETTTLKDVQFNATINETTTDDDLPCVPKGIDIAILTFCIVGSFTYLVEFVHGFYNACVNTKKRKYLPAECYLISTIVEDVPQICLAVIVAVYVKESVGKVQIWKGIFAFGECLTRIITLLIYICRTNILPFALKPSKERKIAVAAINIMFVLGILTCSILIFVGIYTDYFDFLRKETSANCTF